MISKKLKYQELLSQFPNCPPQNYREVSIDAFRWVHPKQHDNDFLPRNLIKNPSQRILDESDKMCLGYGLSLFDSYNGAYNRYKNLYLKIRKNFRNDYGDCISQLKLNFSDGLANLAEENNSGHFTFHEYENVNLREKVTETNKIFKENGEFVD